MKPSRLAPAALRHLEGALADLANRSLLRGRPESRRPSDLSFCSNDYLGLAVTPVPCGPSGGAGASRLVGGDREEHIQLERALASWLGTEEALVFSSAYAANVGTISALAGKGDVVVSDALNHASIIDGARLSGARVVITEHLSIPDVETALRARTEARAWVITESYFSMDADVPDLLALRDLCNRYDAALIVDEAHALGVFGDGGRGCCAHQGIVPDVLIGGFGKSFGASGGFVSGCAVLTEWLWNRARTFVFSTGLSPAIARKALDSLQIIAENSELRAHLASQAERFRRGLAHFDVTALGNGPIVPWVVGEAALAVRISDLLGRRGIHVLAIRPPSVPAGTSRLRFTVTADHTAADIDRALAAIEAVLNEACAKTGSANA